MKTILVTGGAGFIGSHTVDRLLEKGYKVKIIDNLSKPVHLKGKPVYIPSEAEFIYGDVRDKNVMEYALDGIDGIFHFAAYQDYLTDFSKFFDINTKGTALIYEIIVERNLPVKKIVIASSQAVLGEGLYSCKNCGFVLPNIRTEEQLKNGDWEVKCPKCNGSVKLQMTDETVINPQNQYAMSKYTQELIGINLGKRYEIPTTALRYSIVQGPRQSFYNMYSGILRIFCLHLYFNKQPTAYEDGNSIRDYINIQDVVDANILVLEDNKANFEVFNVGGGNPYTVKEFGEIVSKVYNKNIKPRITGEYRYGDIRHIFSDISKLKKLGWTPKVSIEKSVCDYIDYLEKQTDISDIMNFAQKTMKKMNVIRKANSVMRKAKK